MNRKTLYNWVYNYKRDNNLQTYNRTSSKASIKESTEEELRRLRRENRILKQERDSLKKATAPQGHFLQGAYFAKDLGTPLRGELCKVCMDERTRKAPQGHFLRAVSILQLCAEYKRSIVVPSIIG